MLPLILYLEEKYKLTREQIADVCCLELYEVKAYERGSGGLSLEAVVRLGWELEIDPAVMVAYHCQWMRVNGLLK